MVAWAGPIRIIVASDIPHALTRRLLRGSVLAETTSREGSGYLGGGRPPAVRIGWFATVLGFFG
jgi:hypothetical protein